MGKTKYLSAFERGMVVGARHTGLCWELQRCWGYHTQQSPMCIKNGPPPKGHPANLTQLWEMLMLQHTMTFQMILCFQLCGNILGKALSCFSMTMPPCSKRGPYRNGLWRTVWKNLTGLHRALTSTPLNTFGMNWNTDCEPGLIAKHQCLTSLMLVVEWKKSPEQCSKI